MSETEKIIVNLPKEDAEGYFDLLEDWVPVNERLQKEGMTVQVINEMRVFCARFIEASDDEDRERKSHRLSKKNYKDIMRSIGDSEADTIPPA